MDYCKEEYGYISDCCGAVVIWGDVCRDCLEHCTPIKEDEDED